MPGGEGFPQQLIAIDPGSCSGWAMFCAGALSSCGVYKWRNDEELPTVALTPGAPGVVVVELPKVYPGEKRQVPANDLIQLAYRAGMLSQFVGGGAKPGLVTSGGKSQKINVVFPYEWKRQVPDSILYARIDRVLRPEERAVAEAAECAKSYRHNMLDAIGIGLVFLGRSLPGFVGSGIGKEG